MLWGDIHIAIYFCLFSLVLLGIITSFYIYLLTLYFAFLFRFVTDTSGGSFVGRLTVEYGGVYNESYSSQVVHQDPMWVRSEALDSPSFSELVSEWHFKPYVAGSSGITGCEVDFLMINVYTSLLYIFFLIFVSPRYYSYN